MDLADLMRRQDEFDSRHSSRFGWSEPVTPERLDVLQFLVVALAAEVGEAAGVVKAIVRGDVAYEDAQEQIAGELADVFAYLLKCANQIGFDLEAQYLSKLARNEERFARYSTGTEADRQR
jgi:NTP pyrophosphatase (non-canonical NTP hydrolase)